MYVNSRWGSGERPELNKKTHKYDTIARARPSFINDHQNRCENVRFVLETVKNFYVRM